MCHGLNWPNQAFSQIKPSFNLTGLCSSEQTVGFCIVRSPAAQCHRSAQCYRCLFTVDLQLYCQIISGSIQYTTDVRTVALFGRATDVTAVRIKQVIWCFAAHAGLCPYLHLLASRKSWRSSDESHSFLTAKSQVQVTSQWDWVTSHRGSLTSPKVWNNLAIYCSYPGKQRKVTFLCMYHRIVQGWIELYT